MIPALPPLLRHRFIVIDRTTLTIKATVHVPPLVYLQMRFEPFLMAEGLGLALGIWACRGMRRPHMSLKLRPVGEKRQGG